MSTLGCSESIDFEQISTKRNITEVSNGEYEFKDYVPTPPAKKSKEEPKRTIIPLTYEERTGRAQYTYVPPSRVKCYNCDKDLQNLLICQGCTIVPYCSKDCQKMDWKNHKKACRTLKGNVPRQIACKEFWALDFIKEIAENETEEINSHKFLRNTCQSIIDGHVRDDKPDGKSSDLAMLIFDLYSQEYLYSSSIIDELADPNINSSFPEFEKLTLCPDTATRHKMGDCFFICMKQHGETVSSACLVRCPTERGLCDSYMTFHSDSNGYNLLYYLTHAETFEHGGVMDHERAKAYIESLRDYLWKDRSKKNPGVPNHRWANLYLMRGIRFYFKHVRFSLSDVYRNCAK